MYYKYCDSEILVTKLAVDNLITCVNESNDVLSRQQMNSDQIFFNCVVFRWYKIL